MTGDEIVKLAALSCAGDVDTRHRAEKVSRVSELVIGSSICRLREDANDSPHARKQQRRRPAGQGWRS